jgi:hypothetical protein
MGEMGFSDIVFDAVHINGAEMVHAGMQSISQPVHMDGNLVMNITWSPHVGNIGQLATLATGGPYTGSLNRSQERMAWVSAALTSNMLVDMWHSRHRAWIQI